MAGITLAQAESQLSSWLTASTQIAEGQAVTIDGDTLTRANASHVNKMITFWEMKVKRLSRGGGLRSRSITPVT